MLSERYHPERYRQSHPYSKQAATLLARNPGLPTLELVQRLLDLICRTYNNYIMELPFESRPDNIRGVMQESSLAMHYAAFCAHGRQIFHFNDEITEQFLKTDVDEVTLASIQLPHNVFYMSFGKQFSLNLWDSNIFVDGAYITYHKGSSLEILLTTISNDYDCKSDKFDWIFNPDKYYYLALPTEDNSQTLVNLAEIALKEDLAKESESLAQPKILDVDGKMIINRRSETAAIHIGELEKGYPIFAESLRLIINGLCYLSAYKNDVETKWPDDTPISLLQKIEKSSKPKDVRRTVSQLTSMGYIKIHYCGKAFRHIAVETTENSAAIRETRTHWRRGHWRNQAYGQQLSQRRLIWIMPLIVRQDKKAENRDFPGHVYVVDSIATKE